MWLLPTPNMTVVWLRWGETALYIGGVIVGIWLILTGSTWEYYSACQCAECQVVKQEQNIASERLPLIVYFLLWSFFPCKLRFRLHVYRATSSSASSGVCSPLFVVYWHVAESKRGAGEQHTHRQCVLLLSTLRFLHSKNCKHCRASRLAMGPWHAGATWLNWQCKNVAVHQVLFEVSPFSKFSKWVHLLLTTILMETLVTFSKPYNCSGVL